MSFVVANTEFVSGAAGNLARLGSMISAANSAAAAQTTAVAAAGADEVSAAVAALFGAHGQTYQVLSAQAAAFHSQFVQALSGGAQAYAAAEATNFGPLQPLFDVINAPTLALLNRPLIGNGADGTAANPNGQAGGLLIGNGGQRLLARCRPRRQRRRRRHCWATAATAGVPETDGFRAILRLLALQVHREGGQRPTCLPVFEQRLRQLAVGHRAFVLAPSHHRRARGAGLSEAHSTGDGRSQHL